MTPSRVVHRGADRAGTQGPGALTRHAFSFGRHYDPANTGFGALLAVNEEQLEPGAGYPDHPHAGIDIVTWVLEGELVHTSGGGTARLRPGTVRVLRTGAGTTHAEHAPPDAGVRFVQTWLTAGPTPGAVSRAELDVSEALRAGDLVLLAAGPDAGQGGVELGEPGVALHAARLVPGREVLLPDAPLLHLQVTRGAVRVDGPEPESGTVLRDGDASRHTAGPDLTACRTTMCAASPAEVLVWSLPG